MSRKIPQFVGKLWKLTAFHIFSEPGKKESQLVQQSFESIFKAFNTFQKSISQVVNELRNQKLNIPALIKVRQQILKSKPRIQKFISTESSQMEKILSQLSQFRFLLQKSEKNAAYEYQQKINTFILGKEESAVSMRKMEKVHEDFMNLKYDHKTKIRDNPSNSSFEKWLADFHIRSQDYFMKSYSYDWQHEVRQRNTPFVRIRNETYFTQKMFACVGEETDEMKQIKKESKGQKQCLIGFDEQMLKRQSEQGDQSQMKQDQRDIVEQIFQQFENNSFHTLL